MGRPAGFTLVEIIVVLLLMSIVGAVALGRSVTTTQIDLAAKTEKIRSHLRFAQAEAMKRSDTVWGIKFESGRYWLFKGTSPDNAANQVRLPGVEYATGSNQVSLPPDFSLTWNLSDTIFFDRIGKPYRHQLRPSEAGEFALHTSMLHLAGVVADYEDLDQKRQHEEFPFDPHAVTITGFFPTNLPDVLTEARVQLQDALAMIYPRTLAA